MGAPDEDERPDLTSASTEALIEELRDRSDEVGIAEFCTDDDLRDQCSERKVWVADPDVVSLSEATDEEFGDEADVRGFSLVLPEDADRLAELIAERRTQEALELLKETAPKTLSPRTSKYLATVRSAPLFAGVFS